MTSEWKALIAGVVMGFVLGFIIALEVGFDWATADIACPAMLGAAPTLSDSLAVAQRYEECEWWRVESGAPREPNVQPRSQEIGR